MRVILQNPASRLYYRWADEWTPLVEEARDFTTKADAFYFCSHKNLGPVQIVLDFGFRELDTVFLVDFKSKAEAICPVLDAASGTSSTAQPAATPKIDEVASAEVPLRMSPGITAIGRIDPASQSAA